jgi:hypothetical protein
MSFLYKTQKTADQSLLFFVLSILYMEINFLRISPKGTNQNTNLNLKSIYATSMKDKTFDFAAILVHHTAYEGQNI